MAEEPRHIAMEKLSGVMKQQAVDTCRPTVMNPHLQLLSLGAPSSMHGYVAIRKSGDKNGSRLSKQQQKTVKHSAPDAVPKPASRGRSRSIKLPSSLSKCENSMVRTTSSLAITLTSYVVPFTKRCFLCMHRMAPSRCHH